MGAIYVMWHRQIIRYWRSRARMIGSLGQPLLFLVALGFGLGHIYEQAGGGNYIQFLAPGIIGMTVLFSAMFTGIEVIWDRQFGFLKETLVAPVSRTKIMLGKTLGGATISMFQGLVVFLVSLLIGFRPASAIGIIPALIFMFLIAALFTALGTAIASQLEDMQAFPLIINFLIMPLFFLSGALFPLEGLPKALDIIVRINPLSYGVDGVRASLTGVSTLGLGLDFIVVLAVGLIVIAIGTYFFKKTQV